MTDYVPRNFTQHENARLRQENETLKHEVDNLRGLVESLDYLYNASDNFKDDAELMPFLKHTLALSLKLLNTTDGSLALFDDETDELVFVIVVGALSDELTNHRIPANSGIAGWVIKHQQPVLVQNAQTDPRFYRAIDDSFTFRTQSVAAAPLIGDRKTFGLIEVLNQSGDEPFTKDDLALLRLLCRAAGQALAFIDRMPEQK